MFHNEKRTKVAKGLETRGQPGPQPAAADMMELTWDENLARMAQEWANECNWLHRSEFSDSIVAENIAQV